GVISGLKVYSSPQQMEGEPTITLPEGSCIDPALSGVEDPTHPSAAGLPLNGLSGRRRGYDILFDEKGRVISPTGGQYLVLWLRNPKINIDPDTYGALLQWKAQYPNWPSSPPPPPPAFLAQLQGYQDRFPDLIIGIKRQTGVLRQGRLNYPEPGRYDPFVEIR
ncbi:MAG: hypothetical protein RMJ88_16725, partial [Thermogemmata sp.]|nr:hypothetical protein [Thermogemmata sp.]